MQRRSMPGVLRAQLAKGRRVHLALGACRLAIQQGAGTTQPAEKIIIVVVLHLVAYATYGAVISTVNMHGGARAWASGTGPPDAAAGHRSRIARHVWIKVAECF